MAETPDTSESMPAVVEVRRQVRTMGRPATVECAGCGTSVPVRLRGPLPIWCSSTCRHRAWERRRAVAELAASEDYEGPAFVLREVIERPFPIAPERSEWVGVLAELRRQIASHDLPNGCLLPVYEALTVAINQAAYRDRNYNAENHLGLTEHSALAGRQDVIDAQLDTHRPSSAPARAKREAAIQLARRRQDARLRRRFGPR